ALAALLAQGGSSYRWVAATGSSSSAAPIELATGKAVMAIGGFTGSDQSITLARFKQLVAAGEIHYYIAGGNGGGPGGGGGVVSERHARRDVGRLVMIVAANLFVASKAIWYLMRSSGVVSLVLLTAVMALGIATVNRWRPGRRPRFVTASLHRNLSLLAVVFVAVHVATAVVDPYAMVGAVAAFVPFVGHANALWVGLGALSLDLVLALILTSLLRRRVGARLWRGVHWIAYLSWPVAFAHSLGLGTDASAIWLQSLAGACAVAVAASLARRLWKVEQSKHLEL